MARFLRVNFLLAGVLLFIACIVTVISSSRGRLLERQVDDSRTILFDLHALRAGITDAETAQRAYLVTGEPRDFDSYRLRAGESTVLLDRLALETSHSVELASRMAELGGAIRQKLDELDAVARLRRERGFEEVSARLRGGSGYAEMDRIHHLVSSLISTEMEHFRVLDRRMRRQSSVNNAASIGGTLFALIAVLFSGQRTMQSLKRSSLAEDTLRLSEASLREAQEIGVLGNWTIDLGTMAVHWSNEVYSIFRVPTGRAPLSAAELLEYVHPEDRLDLETATASTIQHAGSYSLKYRIVLPTGEVRYLHSRARTRRGPDGTVNQLFGTVLDVTEQSLLVEALDDSKALFNAFMDNSPTLAFIKDREGRMIYMNRACLKMWNFDQIEWKGKWEGDLWSPELAVEFRKLDHEVLDSNRAGSTIETIPLPNGLTVSLLTSKFPILAADGTQLVAAVSIDISAQLDAERRALAAVAEREVLLREIHHRVKNNLQVICSLLGMQAASSDDPITVAALLTSQNRVRSMALIHELLYGGKTLGDIDFADYVEQLVLQVSASLGLDSSRISLRLDAMPLRFEVDRAIPCGLILNELISNAFKHAFPGERAGEIVVRVGSTDEGEIFVAVDDDGVGLPEDFKIEGTRSLGLRVVQILARQIDGQVSVNRRAGSSFEVRFLREAIAA